MNARSRHVASGAPLKDRGVHHQSPIAWWKISSVGQLVPGPGGELKKRNRQDIEDMVSTFKDLQGPLDRQGVHA